MSSVPAKRENEICRHGGRSQRSCKERKRDLQAQRKKPAFLQREKKRFAGTEEEASVPAESEKGVCGNRGSVQRSCKERKRGLQAQRKKPAFLQREKKRFAGTEEVAALLQREERISGSFLATAFHDISAFR
ncbi:hypothetical protein QA612_04685 [Evansella sp. AB-P1]|uniref:hypothetical protein n=1 Tax=Evansella sp. AB-P1 TaxID=3037653 RepID=UPI0024201801|nr:hypothetical protein [Evansella sp. AB-P1]MDG5786778.1 hypothetical protein [Evansella sp. AB-P1]